MHLASWGAFLIGPRATGIASSLGTLHLHHPGWEWGRGRSQGAAAGGSATHNPLLMACSIYVWKREKVLLLSHSPTPCCRTWEQGHSTSHGIQVSEPVLSTPAASEQRRHGGPADCFSSAKTGVESCFCLLQRSSHFGLCLAPPFSILI